MEKQPIKLVLWMALLTSNFIYIALAFFVLEPTDSEPDPLIAYILLAIGISSLALSHFIPNFFTSKLSNETNLELKKQKELTIFIIGLALNEAVALFGFISKIVANNQMICILLFTLSIIGFIFKFPKANNENIIKTKNSLEP